MGLTDFGKTIRKLRIDRDMTLKDLADRSGVTSAYLSALETGRKTLTSDVACRLSALMELTPAEDRELLNAASKTMTEVRLRSDDPNSMAMAMMFARRFESGTLDMEQLRKLLED